MIIQRKRFRSVALAVALVGSQLFCFCMPVFASSTSGQIATETEHSAHSSMSESMADQSVSPHCDDQILDTQENCPHCDGSAIYAEAIEQKAPTYLSRSVLQFDSLDDVAVVPSFIDHFINSGIPPPGFERITPLDLPSQTPVSLRVLLLE